MALTADANFSSIGTPLKAPFSCNAADTFYQGAIVFTDAGGGVQVTHAATLDRVLGISPKQQVTTAAADIVEVYVKGTFWVPVGSNISAADEGDMLMLDASETSTDDFADTVAMMDTGTYTAAIHDSVVGQILRVTSTQMLIHLLPGFTGRALVTTTTNIWT